MERKTNNAVCCCVGFFKVAFILAVAWNLAFAESSGLQASLPATSTATASWRPAAVGILAVANVLAGGHVVGDCPAVADVPSLHCASAFILLPLTSMLLMTFLLFC
jgi:hypothetical protein